MPTMTGGTLARFPNPVLTASERAVAEVEGDIGRRLPDPVHALNWPGVRLSDFIRSRSSVSGLSQFVQLPALLDRTRFAGEIRPRLCVGDVSHWLRLHFHWR